jgi:uncharacterized repeat protein (TIGR01451 family)
MCAQAVVALFAGATLQAQNIVSVSDSPSASGSLSPSGRFILGLMANPTVSGEIFLPTSQEVFNGSYYSGSRLTFLKKDDFTDIVVGLDVDALAVTVPNKLIYTGVFAFSFSIFTVDPPAHTSTHVAIDDSAFPTGMAVDSSGAMYLYTTTGVGKYANTSTGTRSLTMGASGSGAGQLSIPGGALAAGPGGVLYALDPGNNRVARFDTTTGSYLGNIALSGPTATTALVVSPNGRLYTANGNGGGTVYDALTGVQIETFSSLATNPDGPPGGNASLFLDGRGLIYLYDAATGMHVFSDPASLAAAGADIAVRLDGPATVTAGVNSSYNVTVTKKGATDTLGVTLTDALPAGTTFVSESQTAGPPFTCTNPGAGATGSVSCTIATFPAPASATFTIVLKVDAGTALPALTNTATASSAIPDTIPFDDSASSTAKVRVSTDVAVTSSGPAAVISGNDVTYICTVTNNGPSAAHGVVMSDASHATTFVSETQNSGPAFTCTNPQAGGSGLVNCTIPTLDAGASAVFTIVVHLGVNTTGTTLVNKVTVSSSTPDPTPGNNSASSVATVNLGASLIVAVADLLPPFPGVHSVIIGLVAGAFYPGKVNLVTVADLYAANYYSGSSFAFVKATDVSGVLVLDESSRVVATSNRLIFTATPGFLPSVSTFDGAGVVGSVPIDDTDLPPGFALDASGAMYLYTTTGVAKYADSSTGTRSFTMGASGSGAGQLSIPGGAVAAGPGGVLYAIDPGNNRIVRFDTTTGNYLGSIPLTGTTATTTLAVTANGRLYTTDGDGGGTIYNALTGAILAAFKSTAVNSDAAPGGITALFLDGRGYIYLYDAATGIHVFSDPASGSTDLAVSTGGPASINAGSNVSYSVTVTNNGPNDAQNVTLSDALPAGTTFVSEAQGSGPAFTCTNPAVGATGSVSCMIATLASGGSAAFTLVFRVHAGATSGSTVTNVATVSYPGSDPTPGNNSASTAAATISTSVDVSVAASGPAAIIAGNSISYNITATNSGPSDAQSVTLSDALPAGTTFVSEAQSSGPAFTCTNPAVGTTGSISCTTATLASGASATFTYVFRVNASAAGGITITNVATISSLTSDLATANNSSSSPAIVSTAADLVIAGSGPAAVAAGNNITYGVTLTNNGPSDAQSVSLTDATPAGTTFVSRSQGSGPAFPCTTPTVGGTGSVVCTIATLASGASASFIVVDAVSIATPAGTTIMNTATVMTTTTDPTPGNNSVNAATTVSASVVDLAITNTPSAPPYGTGLPVTYTVVVSNAGPAAASGVVVTDTIPPGTMFNAATPTQGSCSGTSAITCSLGTLAGGTSATVTLVLTLPATPGSLSSIVMVTASNPDANPANNSSTSLIAVIPASAIPVVSPVALLLLALAMTLLGVSRLRT